MRPQPRYDPGENIGGRYLVHRALPGGMGEVYLCLDLEANVPVALKTFQERFLTDLKVRALFEEEVATLVALEKHPHIVRCFYMVTLDNIPFMLLEWIAGDESRGTDLRGWLRHGPLKLRLALQFVIDIIRGLIHAHEKQSGMVHRDLKPRNVLVAQGPVGKVTDFGLATVAERAGLEIAETDSKSSGRQSLMGHEGIVGTPPYMAPEQWLGQEVDQRTDLYAVGCILFELLTGRWPYQADTREELLHQHLEAPVPNIASEAAIPDELNHLVRRCLTKEQEGRPSDAGKLAMELNLIYDAQFGETTRELPQGEGFSALDHSNRGTTHYALGRHEEALTDFSRAIQLDPNSTWAYNNRGNTFNAVGQHEKALVDFRRALELDANDARTYYNRGTAYHTLGRHKEALADLDRTLELDPNNAQTYINRADTYRAVGRYEAALADHDRAIGLHSESALAFDSRGATYYAVGRHREALADFDNAIELDPTLIQAYVGRGNTYQAFNKPAHAPMDHNRAIDLDPNDAST